ncbi:MAG: hypothetical protein R2744_11190 [Bacteroidales bacterium]
MVKSKKIFVVNTDDGAKYSSEFQTLIRKVVVNGDSTYFPGGTFFTTDDNEPACLHSHSLVRWYLK